jgi:hypothetical protein
VLVAADAPAGSRSRSENEGLTLLVSWSFGIQKIINRVGGVLGVVVKFTSADGDCSSKAHGEEVCTVGTYLGIKYGPQDALATLLLFTQQAKDEPSLGLQLSFCLMRK